MSDRSHWEGIYETRSPESVSWFQPAPVRSLAMIRAAAADLTTPVIDVGGGASVLVDELLKAGYLDLTVLDLAPAALEAARARLGAAAAKVRWVEGDIRTAPLSASHYGVWHDRAVFHFLTEAADRAAYVAQVERTVRPGGHVIIATFAEDGPARCSGLPVVRYSPAALHRVLGPRFELLASEREEHTTPAGGRQAFIYCLCRRLGAGVTRSS